MIKEIIVNNARSIKNARISFEKSGIEYKQKYIFRENYINPVTLYGDNGSGKSMILFAIKQLVLFMNYEEKFIAEESEIYPNILGYEFKNDGEAIELPILFFAFETKDGFKFNYGFSSFGSEIVSETLFIDDVDTVKPVLKRTNGSYSIMDEKSIDIKSSYSAVRQIGIEEYSDEYTIKKMIKKCYECMQDVIYIDSDENAFGNIFHNSKTPMEILTESNTVSDYISAFSSLPKFEVIIKENSENQKNYYMDFGNNKTLPFGAFSDGIKREAHLLSALKYALDQEDTVVVIDELSRSIHPLNSKKIVDEFVNKNIQLLFSSHDTSLLKFLRPDQVYFSYLTNDIESKYYRLNELHPNIREINNIEAMYLKGIFDNELAEKNN